MLHESHAANNGWTAVATTCTTENP